MCTMGDVRGDFLGPPHGTTPAAVITNKNKTDIARVYIKYLQKGTNRQRSGKGAIRKRFPLQNPRWEKTKLTIRYIYHETYRKPNEQLFSQKVATQLP